MIFIFMIKKLFLFFCTLASVCVLSSVTCAQVIPQISGVSVLPAEQVQPSAILADYIVAIVQHEPITNSQLQAQIFSIRYNNEGQQLPPDDELREIALQQLITQSALAQRAQEYGFSVDSQVLSQAVSSVARNNGMTVEELKRAFENRNIPFSTLTRTIEQQMLINQLRERTLDRSITVSNVEVEAYLAQSSSATDPGQMLISLAQVLIAVPEDATPEQEQALAQRAQEVYEKARLIQKPEDFIALVAQYSDDPMKAQTSGALGIMPVSQYPEVFIETVHGLAPGQVAPPVRTGAGFHVLLVLDREQSNMVMTQTHVRHILVNIDAKRTEAEAIALLQESKRQLDAGMVSFEELAQELSQDASAKSGGDLGWAVPGMFVPEFEQVMNQLKPGEISAPVVTRFGVHLIEVLERREAQLTPVQQREVARQTIHQMKVEQAYPQWASEIESETYVERRDFPVR